MSETITVNIATEQLKTIVDYSGIDVGPLGFTGPTGPAGPTGPPGPEGLDAPFPLDYISLAQNTDLDNSSSFTKVYSDDLTFPLEASKAYDVMGMLIGFGVSVDFRAPVFSLIIPNTEIAHSKITSTYSGYGDLTRAYFENSFETNINSNTLATSNLSQQITFFNMCFETVGVPPTDFKVAILSSNNGNIVRMLKGSYIKYRSYDV